MTTPSAKIVKSKAKDAARSQPELFSSADVSFEREFTKLNKDQRKAVEAIEGPVMCIAGPGTGKTQVVALRVANILRRTQMRPGNILCLTFSNSGAAAMRDRLRGLIGPEAYAVEVATLHGFCNQIIQRYPQVFEEWEMLEQVSDLERYRIVNTIIDQNIENIRVINRKSPYQRTKDILDKITQFKREGKTMDELEKATDVFDAQMREKSKAGTKVHEKNLLAARKFKDLVKIYGAYQEAMKSSQRYDYEDMILTVIKALKDNDWLLESLQVRYQYLLVDEFQDTNGAQYQLIELLTATPEATGEPNVFIVGDDDQAIYRFQGANIHNIFAFHKRFPNAPIVVLTTSYRCSQPILDAAGSLIAHNTERLVGTVPGLTKTLISSRGRGGDTPGMVYTPSDELEPWVIADLIENFTADGVPYSEISVLVQRNGDLPLLYKVLRSRDIPVELTGKVDLLDHDTVRQAITLLRAVEKLYDSALLAAALAVDALNTTPADLGRLFAYRRDQSKSLLDILNSIDIPVPPELHLDHPEAILAARDLLQKLHQKIESRSLLSTVEELLRTSGLLNGSAQARDPIDIVALQGFFRWIEQRCLEHPSFTLHALLEDLSGYGNPDYSDVRLRYAFPHMVEDGVQLMTAHQSKGLEFDVVILADFQEGRWSNRRPPSGITIPEDILFGWHTETKDFEKSQDERRVCYVAMTRARKSLIFTCPRQMVLGQKARDASPSAFFAEAGRLPETERAPIEAIKATRLLATTKRDIDAEFATFLRRRLKDFELSPSALNHFLKDPQMFLNIDLLQMPEEKRPALLYGNAVHEALAKWGASVKEGLPLGLDRFIKEFEEYILSKDVFTEKERIGLLSTGRESLERYYRQCLTSNLPIIHSVEHMVKARLGDIPLKGHIDRIDLEHPDSAIASVIDYKTGRTKTMGQIKSEDVTESLWAEEGDNYRQLVFYALLMELGEPFLKAKSFVLDFIGDPEQEPIRRVIEISGEEKKQLTAMIRAAWEKIVNLDFTPLERP